MTDLGRGNMSPEDEMKIDTLLPAPCAENHTHSQLIFITSLKGKNHSPRLS